MIEDQQKEQRDDSHKFSAIKSEEGGSLPDLHSAEMSEVESDAAKSLLVYRIIQCITKIDQKKID